MAEREPNYISTKENQLRNFSTPALIKSLKDLNVSVGASYALMVPGVGILALAFGEAASNGSEENVFGLSAAGALLIVGNGIHIHFLNRGKEKIIRELQRRSKT